MNEQSLEERKQTLVEKLKKRAVNFERKTLEEIVIILIDNSGSMEDYCKSGLTKLDAVKQSIPFLQARGSYVGYGMVIFSTTAIPIQQPTTNFSSILIQLDILLTEGSTNIPAALREGLQMFLERTVDKKRMILLSDGCNNVEQEMMDQRISDCIRENVIVDTIAFGDNADINLLKSISTRTGGMFQKVNSPLQLEEAYKKLNFQVRYLEHKNGG